MAEKKAAIIGAAICLILRQGVAATTLDQICEAAGVTKGALFHYFKGKEEVCLAAMAAWGAHWAGIVAAAQLDEIPDPLDRVYRLLEVMENAYLSSPIGPGCMVGTVAQEQAACSDTYHLATSGHLDDWKGPVAKLLSDAKEAHPPKVDFEPESLADLMLAIVQGTLLVAKTRRDTAIVCNNIAHLRRYIDMLFW